MVNNKFSSGIPECRWPILFKCNQSCLYSVCSPYKEIIRIYNMIRNTLSGAVHKTNGNTILAL
jgi:hypothetical protein